LHHNPVSGPLRPPGSLRGTACICTLRCTTTAFRAMLISRTPGTRATSTARSFWNSGSSGWCTIFSCRTGCRGQGPLPAWRRSMGLARILWRLARG